MNSYEIIRLESISKVRLSPHDGLAGQLKMLTYCVYVALFHLPAPCPEP
jgi:hypothetical protein